MLFSSISFLYGFLPLIFVCYFAAPPRWRNAVLFVFSLLFYFYGEPKYTALMLISSLSDYLFSLYIDPRRGTKKAKIALICSIAVNLLLLGVFKYADFVVSSINALLHLQIPLPRLALPIGISFFTFQTMSYTIDVYRGRVKAQKNLLTVATYVSLFPQLIAGPIVRYSTVENELSARTHSVEGFALGTRRFVVGLSKKTLLANPLGELSAALLGAHDASVLGLWVGSFAFVLQIYFDFSGYSDMAIGLGRMFGFRFPENFDYPLTAKSISEFWRRWHMTLSSWFRDYVYIPLGGNRVKPLRFAINLSVVWALTGLWHGAAWNFVLWGLYFALLLSLEKLLLLRMLEKAPAFIRHMYTLFFVLISFVLFNADAPNGIEYVLRGMFLNLALPIFTHETLYYIKSYAMLLLLGAIGATPLMRKLFENLSARMRRVSGVFETLGAAVLLLLTTAYLVDGAFNPFLYFRF